MYRAVPSILALTWLVASCSDNSGGDIQEPPPDPAPVAQVTVTGPATEVQVGQTLQLTASAQDAAGAPLEGRTFAWTTSDETLATVSSAGLVSGVAPGSVEISATSEGVAGTMAVTVT